MTRVSYYYWGAPIRRNADASACSVFDNNYNGNNNIKFPSYTGGSGRNIFDGPCVRVRRRSGCTMQVDREAINTRRPISPRKVRGTFSADSTSRRSFSPGRARVTTVSANGVLRIFFMLVFFFLSNRTSIRGGVGGDVRR